MSYSNGILGWSREVASSEAVVVKGEKGDPGIGFKLTSDGNYDLKNKKVYNLDTPDDHKVDDDYSTRVTDLKSAVNKEYLNDTFMKRDENGNYFDLKGTVIKNSEPYYDGLYDDNDLVPKKYVDTENATQNIAIADKTSKVYVDAENASLDALIANKTTKSYVDNADSELSNKVEQVDNKKWNINGRTSMNVDLDLGNNKLVNLAGPIQNNDGETKEYVDVEISKVGGSNNSLPLDGSKSMTGDLDMNNNKIINLLVDENDDGSAVKVEFVNKKINESHITNSNSKKDVFRYLMEDVNESLSENNIIVDGIQDYAASPHDINKKVYVFRMGKGSQNEYSSRLGFNVFVLPQGEYTLATEFIPPIMDQVSVSVVSTQLNIGQQSTKLFSTYSRSIVYLHKYSSTAPQRIFIDLRCQGVVDSPAQGRSHLVIYGIEGRQNDVNSDVYDEIHTIQGDKMTFLVKVEFPNTVDFDDDVNFLKATNFNENIDMKNHQIKNLQDGVENNDTVNIKQLNELEDSLVKFFRREMQTKIDRLNQKILDLEKQVSRVALHDQVFKKLFEFYADLLDPDEFVRSGPNVTALNDLNLVTKDGSPSSKPFSDFSMTYGSDNFYGEMYVDLDLTEDSTIFAVVKIDFNINSPKYMDIYIRAKRGFKIYYGFKKANNTIPYLEIDFKGTFKYLMLTGDNAKYVNKQIMIWSTKVGNKLSTTIAGIDPKETTESQTQSQEIENIHFFSIKSAYLLRLGFTTNSYPIGGDAFNAVVSAEKKLGTYFGLN